MQIETTRLILKPIKLSDAQDIFEYAKDPDTGPRAGFKPHETIEDTKFIINYWLSPESTEEQFVVVLKEENKVIGTSGITHLNKHLKNSKNHIAVKMVSEGKNVWEIGLTIARVHWGKGIATEVIGAIMDFLFKVKNADIVMATHSDQNIGSEKAQIKCGLKELGEYDCGHTWYNTESSIHIVRAKTRNEWLNEKEKIKN